MPGRILVIEDNAASLDLMTYLLETFGHVTYGARDGQEGVEMAGAHHPDLIICDIQLPKLDGYGVVRQVKSDPATCAIPIIAVTALAMVGDRDRVLQAGFDGYISKPIDPEVFLMQIEPYLSGHVPQASIPDPPPPGQQPAPAGLATILVVDNVDANLELTRSILEPYGYRVITASGGREALEVAVRERPDLILSDVCMADGTGYEFIGSVKADSRLSAIPFLFITSSMMEEEDRAKGLALGAMEFLFRPIDSEELLMEIESWLPERGRHA